MRGEKLRRSNTKYQRAPFNEHQDAYQRLGRVEETMEVDVLHSPVDKERTKANDLTLDWLTETVERINTNIAKVE